MNGGDGESGGDKGRGDGGGGGNGGGDGGSGESSGGEGGGVDFLELYYRGKTPDATAAYTEILPPADRILVQTRHTDAIKARAACATVDESPEPSPSCQPCLAEG